VLGGREPPGQPVPMTQATPTDRSRELGRYGEAYAARHLIDQGMVVLDRNWRCAAGEIDLVLRDGDVLVVCEVKTRSSTAFGAPLETVTSAKAERLQRLAALWLEERGIRPAGVRVDLVGVLLRRRGAPEVEHAVGVA
jgi:putative endonuclease